MVSKSLFKLLTKILSITGLKTEHFGVPLKSFPSFNPIDKINPLIITHTGYKIQSQLALLTMRLL